MRAYIVTIGCFFLLCCKLENNNSFKYFPNGNLKQKTFINDKGKKTVLNYFEDYKDIVKSVVRRGDSTKHIIEYFPNNKKKKVGNYYQDSLKIGKWSFFDLKGNLKEVHEYLIIDKKSYLNQNWILGSKGDTIGGNYFELNFNDTVNKNEGNRFHFFLTMPLLSNESDTFIILAKKQGEINSDFSNRNKILWDTIFSVATKYPEKKELKDRKFDILLDVFSNKVGTANLKGILVEKDKSKRDSADFITREIFFDIDYYILGRAD